jgi:hypothetical protein
MRSVRVLTLFSSPKCSLWFVACVSFVFFFVLIFTKSVPVKKVLAEAVEASVGQLRLEVIDITKSGNEEWFKRYWSDIPVVHLGGDEIARHHLSKEELAKMLS